MVFCCNCGFDAKDLVAQGKIKFCPICSYNFTPKANKMEDIKVIERDNDIEIEGESDVIDNIIKKVSLRKVSQKQQEHLKRLHASRSGGRPKGTTKAELEKRKKENEKIEEEKAEVKKEIEPIKKQEVPVETKTFFSLF